MNDIHLIYIGGSGGHICAHVILEAHQHYCVMRDHFDHQHGFATATEFDSFFRHIKQTQWNISNHKEWKAQEFWPCNQETQASSVLGRSRFYLTCNPEPADITSYPAKRVMLYTDIETQLELAHYKRAWTFYIEPRAQLAHRWDKNYNEAKDPGWPDCKFEDINSLPDVIKHELMTQHQGFDVYFNWREHRPTRGDLRARLQERDDMISRSIEYQGVRINRDLLGLTDQVDVVVKLQDVIKTQGRTLLDALDLPWSQSHADLIQHWLDLHPAYLKSRLLS